MAEALRLDRVEMSRRIGAMSPHMQMPKIQD